MKLTKKIFSDQKLNKKRKNCPKDSSLPAKNIVVKKLSLLFLSHEELKYTAACGRTCVCVCVCALAIRTSLDMALGFLRRHWLKDMEAAFSDSSSPTLWVHLLFLLLLLADRKLPTLWLNCKC